MNLDSIAVPAKEPRGHERDVAEPEVSAREQDENASPYLEAAKHRLLVAALKETSFFPLQAAQTFDAGNVATNGPFSVTLRLPMRFIRSCYVKNMTGKQISIFAGEQPGSFNTATGATQYTWFGAVLSVVPSAKWEIVPVPDTTQAITFAGTGNAVGTSALLVVAVTDAIWTPGEGTAS